jgi:hypothetical protein
VPSAPPLVSLEARHGTYSESAAPSIRRPDFLCNLCRKRTTQMRVVSRRKQLSPCASLDTQDWKGASVSAVVRYCHYSFPCQKRLLNRAWLTSLVDNLQKSIPLAVDTTHDRTNVWNAEVSKSGSVCRRLDVTSTRLHLTETSAANTGSVNKRRFDRSPVSNGGNAVP